MRRFLTAMVISLAAHGAVMLVLSAFRYAAVEPQAVEIAFLSSPPPIIPPPQTPPSYLPRRDSVALPTVAAHDEITEIAADSTPDSLHVNRLNFFRPNATLRSFSLPDSLPSDRLESPLVLKKKNEPLLHNRPGPYDAVQSRIDRRNLGGERPVSLSDLAQAANALAAGKEQDKPVRLDFVPSAAELEILSIIWEKPQVNDIEIYASLDSSIKVTAEEMQGILAKLVEKRLLSRKLVSPQNELSLPFGAAVEMSAQNRRNRVFEYQARIDAQEILRYLNALLYQVERAPGARTPAELRKIAELKERILQAGR